MIEVRAVRWSPSWRVIPTRYTEDRVLGKVADIEDMEITSGVEQMTSDGRRHDDEEVAFVPDRERAAGAGSRDIMRPVIYRNPDGSRFSDGVHGVYYAARTLATAVEETRHHRAVFMSRTKEGPMRLEMRVLTADLDGDLHDIRGQQKKRAALYHRVNYSSSQDLARELLKEGSSGIVYDSVRHKGGQCAAVFRPTVLSRCRSAGLLTFEWDGAEVSKVYELREYK
ncbi:MAG: RES family NAD+ phosphorylase [Elusimicrobia bacterium]|nr:RES family NAD+ phosphorylase [Elusimicrobiota bacterium]